MNSFDLVIKLVEALAWPGVILFAAWVISRELKKK